MYQLHFTPQARSDITLVLYGYSSSWKDRSSTYDRLVQRALHDIQTNPACGKRYRVRHRFALHEVRTYHIGRFGKPAVHKFVYRLVGKRVEVGRLLHQEMEVEGNLPAEWVVDAA